MAVRHKLKGRPKIPAPSLQTLWSLPPRLILSRLYRRLAQRYYRSRFYNNLLGFQPSGRPVLSLPDTYPGNPAIGLSLIKGELPFGDRVVQDPIPLTDPLYGTPAWREELARFDWIKDLRALGGPTARRVAQLMVQRWLEEKNQYEQESWRADLVASRLRNLLLYFPYLQEESGEGRSVLLRGIARHASHLRRALPDGLQGSALAKSAASLMMAGLMLPKADTDLRRGRAILKQCLPQQILADGCHGERNPSYLLSLLEYLTDLKLIFAAAGQALPPYVKASIEQLSSALNVFRHSDGAFALFNGGYEESRSRIDFVLQRGQVSFHPLMQLPLGGYQRLAAGQSVLILDTGRPASRGLDSQAHAGTLSFEFSHEGERLIVNCGAYPFDGAWKEAARKSAAHSTLILDDTDSALILAGDGLVLGPKEVSCRRDEDAGRVWIDAQHDGYEESHETLHRRRLFLSANGMEVRGEDQLLGPGGIPFTLRFHLHPDIELSFAQDGQSVLLKTRKHIFRLRLAEGPLVEEESIYLGQPGRIQPSRQLVYHGTSQENQTLIRWALSREDRKP